MPQKHRISVSLEDSLLEWVRSHPGSDSKVIGDYVKKAYEQPADALVVSFRPEVMGKLKSIADEEERQVEDQVQWIVRTWVNSLEN